VKDLLVTGAKGQLGSAILTCARDRGLSVVGKDIVGDDSDRLDITSRQAVIACIDAVQPVAVVSCAAFTGVDRCEDEEELATAVNGTAVGHLAAACNRVGAVLVQISTDYVFQGNASRPYREYDPVDPINAYGRSKLFGEELARTADEHLILRTAWLCGRGGHNFVEAIRKQIESGKQELSVVADQTGCPTFCDDLAEIILDLLDRDARGLLHTVSSGVTSWHGFACEIAKQLAADVEILPVTTAEFPRRAPRPSYSVLDTSRLATLGVPVPNWQQGLQRYLEATCDT
jgi:dTDP-4-dehydrorhamnose reductase